MKDKILVILTWAGMLLILIGMAIPFFTGPLDNLFKYVFGAGAVLNLVGRLFTQYNGKNIRLKRLLRIETWASLFFCVAVYFMFEDPDPKNWIVFVLAGGALFVYTSLMIPRVQRNDEKK